MNNEIVTYENEETGFGQILLSAIPVDINPETVFNALNNADSLADTDQKIFNVVGFMLTEGVRNDPTGKNEPTPCVNTTLVCADGKSFFSQSTGIARSTRTLMTVFGAPENWPDEGIILEVRSQKLPNGTELKTLRIPS